jgi:hypothetical protein
MKRTLVERVAGELCRWYMNMACEVAHDPADEWWAKEARRIIAMVRRNDRRRRGDDN